MARRAMILTALTLAIAAAAIAVRLRLAAPLTWLLVTAPLVLAPSVAQYLAMAETTAPIPGMDLVHRLPVAASLASALAAAADLAITLLGPRLRSRGNCPGAAPTTNTSNTRHESTQVSGEGERPGEEAKNLVRVFEPGC